MTLAWPAGRKRTQYPKRSAFDANVTMARATSDLTKELNALRARDLVIEVDQRVRLTSGSLSRAQADDKGVVVRFTLPSGQKVVMCCDRWDKQEHNLRAIAYTIEAKRATERWGCASQSEEYAGYEALPANSVSHTALPPLHSIFGIAVDANAALYRAAWKVWVVQNHPDKGGNNDYFAKVKAAYEATLVTEGAPA